MPLRKKSPKVRVSGRRGTIEERPHGRWLVRVALGWDPVEKKRIRLNVTVRGKRADAERKRTELLGKQDTGVPLPRSRFTLGDWLDEYAATWSGQLGPSTRRQAACSLRTYLPGWFRGVKLQALTAKTFQQLYNDLSTAGKAPGTVNYLHRVLRARVAKAVQLGHLAHNPVAAAKPPKPRLRENKTLQPDQARVFLSLAEEDRYGTLWMVLLQTGLRPGEALGLQWADLEGNALRIRRALVRVGRDGWTLEPTKTDSPRSVPLAPVALRLLQQHKARQAEAKLLLGSEYAAHGFIFASTFGEPLHWSTITSRHFRPLLARLALRLLHEPEAPDLRAGMTRSARREALSAFRERASHAIGRAGLAGLRPYDLRHSAATLLLAAGEHPKIVAELLGHSRIGLTLDTYSHVIPGMVDRATDRLEHLILGTAQEVQRGA